MRIAFDLPTHLDLKIGRQIDVPFGLRIADVVDHRPMPAPSFPCLDDIKHGDDSGPYAQTRNAQNEECRFVHRTRPIWPHLRTLSRFFGSYSSPMPHQRGAATGVRPWRVPMGRIGPPGKAAKCFGLHAP